MPNNGYIFDSFNDHNKLDTTSILSKFKNYLILIFALFFNVNNILLWWI
jgi:hypothetical protein